MNARGLTLTEAILPVASMAVLFAGGAIGIALIGTAAALDAPPKAAELSVPVDRA